MRREEESFVIRTSGLTKTYGNVCALDGVDLTVDEGTVLGLLGHNGAGKTTLVHILSTLLPPSSGKASVAGFDVMRQSRQVRERIGLTGQYASVDERFSGRENLVIIGRLLGASKKQARDRADELLHAFDLVDAADRSCQLYSGGMRRRLDLAVSLVGRPQVIFLDEPSTGLDPVSRSGLWEQVENLVAEGATVLLTTQYLEEAERLADKITVLSRGAVVAAGTPSDLKGRIGERRADLEIISAADVPRVFSELRRCGLPVLESAQDRIVSISISSFSDFTRIVHSVEGVQDLIAGISVSEPSLDDVYFSLAR